VALSIFTDQRHPPSDSDLEAALGRSAPLWHDLKAQVEAIAAGADSQWKFAGRTIGWGFRLSRAARVVIYMTPCQGHFLASVVLGEKAIARARATRLTARVEALIDAAPRYAEGRGVRMTVTRRADLATALSLVRIKLAV
jgi:uncharacterized protein DUF3788